MTTATKAPRITYAKDPLGDMQETEASIRRRLSAAHGFMQSKIVLLEASYDPIRTDRLYHYCSDVLFSVNGKEFRSDFYDLYSNDVYRIR